MYSLSLKLDIISVVNYINGVSCTVNSSSRLHRT